MGVPVRKPPSLPEHWVRSECGRRSGFVRIDECEWIPVLTRCVVWHVEVLVSVKLY